MYVSSKGRNTERGSGGKMADWITGSNRQVWEEHVIVLGCNSCGHKH